MQKVRKDNRNLRIHTFYYLSQTKVTKSLKNGSVDEIENLVL